MFDRHMLASTEYYQHRFQNFSTMTLVPAAVFVIAVFGFLLIAKCEVTVRTVGELAPKSTPVSIQSSVSSRIVLNRLKEGKAVSKGQTLVIYHHEQSASQTKLLKAQRRHLLDQQTALMTLKQSIGQNQDRFTKDDIFGYRQLLNDYLSQRHAYQMESKQISVAQGSEDDKATRMQDLLQKQIDTTSATQADDRQLLTAIEKNTDYPTQGMHHALFESYKLAVKGLTGDERAKTAATYEQQVQAQIDTLNDTIDNLKIQLIGATKSDTSIWQVDEVDDKIQSLQASQLKDTNTQLSQVQEQLVVLATRLAQTKDASQDYRIKAPTSGVLHVNSSVSGNRLIQAGTQLAQIMPVITKHQDAKLKLLVSPNVVTSIRKDQSVRLRISRNIPTPVIISGQVTSIAVAPTITKSGNLFQVTAKVTLNPELTKQLHYGMAGQVSIITGKKTYWQFIVDRLLNRA